MSDALANRPGGRRGAHLALAALLLLSLGLNFTMVWWGLPDARGWAFDEVHPGQVKTPGAWPEKYPPVHRYALRAAYLPVDAAVALGVIESENSAYQWRFLAGRLLSVLMATLTVWLIYRSARTHFSRWASLVAAAAVAFIPSCVYYAKTVNLDAPYLFWFALSLFFYLRLLDGQRLRDYLLFAATAVLAFGTKDHVYAVYLLTPLPILIALRRSRGAGFLTDRRLWLTALVGVGLFALIYQLFLGPGELRQHLEVMTGPRTFAIETDVPSSAAGRAWLAARQVAYSLGLPLSLLALLGLVDAVRKRRWRLLSLLLLSAGYFLGFLIIPPYQNLRYLLPVAFFGALFAAGGVAALAGRSGWRRPVSVGAAAILVFSFLRALSVDVALMNDSRYFVERWLDERGALRSSLGIGREVMLPRGLAASGFENLRSDGCEVLERNKPEFLVVSLGDFIVDRERVTAEWLERGEFNYDEVLRYRSRPRLRIPDFSGLWSNLDKINPEIVVFRRQKRRCVDARNLPVLLGRLRETRDRKLRRDLAAAIGSQNFPGLGGSGGEVGLPGRGRVEEGALAVGLRGQWTRGTDPAALLVTNDGETPGAIRVRVGCLAPEEVFPNRFWIDNGSRLREFVLKSRGRVTVGAGVLAPGTSRLLLIWSEKAWRPQSGEERRLGVSVLGVSLAPVAGKEPPQEPRP